MDVGLPRKTRKVIWKLKKKRGWDGKKKKKLERLLVVIQLDPIQTYLAPLCRILIEIYDDNSAKSFQRGKSMDLPKRLKMRAQDVQNSGMKKMLWNAS